jgi:CheY-like chemotaxis protein
MDMRKKILIVDDSKTVLLMEKMILTRQPYDIVVAHNGAEAVTKAALEMPDAILMDVMMPEMNGLDACREIKRSSSTSHIPIILVTTKGESVYVEAGYTNGCSDYVTKPINAMELIAKLQNVLAAVAEPRVC